MIKKITDLILDHVFRMSFLPEDDRKKEKKILYQNAEKLYAANPQLFNSASLELLENHVQLLETEIYQIKMECAQIWHKNSFDVWVFQIRYYLKLATEFDLALLQRKIKSTYSCKGQSFINIHDSRIGYNMLFNQILNSNDPEDQNIKVALQTVLSADIVNDVDGVITYVIIHKLTKSKNRIPHYYKTIYISVTNVSVIQADGLYGWLIENKTSTLRKLYVALKELGLKESACYLLELDEYIKANQIVSLGETEDGSVIKKIEMFERKLLDSLKGNDIEALAKEYLLSHIAV